MLAKRSEEGAHALLFPRLVANEEKFFNYFRMSQLQFHELYEIIRPRIERRITTYRVPIAAQERFAMTLR